MKSLFDKKGLFDVRLATPLSKDELNTLRDSYSFDATVGRKRQQPEDRLDDLYKLNTYPADQPKAIPRKASGTGSNDDQPELLQFMSF